MIRWFIHDDVIKLKHFPRYWPFCAGNSPVTGEFPSQRPVSGVWYFLRSTPKKNGSVNNRNAGDLRRHRAHCGVTLMMPPHFMRGWVQTDRNHCPDKVHSMSFREWCSSFFMELTTVLHHTNLIQCHTIITKSIFSKILTLDTPQGEMWSVLCDYKFDLCNTWVTAMLYEISSYTGPCYNGIRLHETLHLISLTKQHFLQTDFE